MSLFLSDGSGATTFVWDGENRLVRIEYPGGQSTRNLYTADGLRQRRSTSDGVTGYVWDGVNVLEELDGSGAERHHYTDSPGVWGGLVSQKTVDGADAALFNSRRFNAARFGQSNSRGISGGSNYFGFDGSDDTRQMLDASGGVTSTLTYLPFGEQIQPSGGASSSPYAVAQGRFGYQQEDERLRYVRARYLDVVTGRWLSRDPLGFGGGDVNLYRNVGNDPVNETDPSGMDPYVGRYPFDRTFENQADYVKFLMGRKELIEKARDAQRMGTITSAQRNIIANQERYYPGYDFQHEIDRLNGGTGVPSHVSAYRRSVSNPLSPVPDDPRLIYKVSKFVNDWFTLGSAESLGTILGQHDSGEADGFLVASGVLFAATDAALVVVSVTKVGNVGKGLLSTSKGMKGKEIIDFRQSDAVRKELKKMSQAARGTFKESGPKRFDNGQFIIEKKAGARYWTKKVNPNMPGLVRWWAKGELRAQIRMLQKLETMAPRFAVRKGVLITEDIGKYEGGYNGRFMRILVKGSKKSGNYINDIRPRNIGATGQIHDPAYHPIAQWVWVSGIGSASGYIIVPCGQLVSAKLNAMYNDWKFRKMEDRLKRRK